MLSHSNFGIDYRIVYLTKSSKAIHSLSHKRVIFALIWLEFVVKMVLALRMIDQFYWVAESYKILLFSVFL